MSPSLKRSSGAMIAGLVIIAVGAVLLLNQFGVFPYHFVAHFWPVVLIVVGLIKLFTSKDRGEMVFGGCLIGAGIILQTNSLGITHITWGQAWPLFIIVVGLMVVAHSLSGKSCGGSRVSTDEADLDSFYIFGGGERNVNAKDFRSARLFAVFGGYEVDLTRAEMAGNDAYVEANAVFGGGEIRVPLNWKVVVQGMGIFGGYNDKTQHVQTDATTPAKILYIRGVAVFGGVEVKN
jgi:predicted membrane protein